MSAVVIVIVYTYRRKGEAATAKGYEGAPIKAVLIFIFDQ